MNLNKRNHFLNRIHNLKKVVSYIDEIQTNEISQQKRSFLIYKFIPQLMLLVLIVTLYSILDYLGPITLDLLTKQYYRVESQEVNSNNDFLTQFIEDTLSYFIGPQSGVLNLIIALSIILIIVNLCRDYVRVLYQRMGKKLRMKTNIFLQNIIYEKSMKLYTNTSNIENMPEQKVMTFHNMLTVLERLDSAIDEFLYIVQVTVELFIGFYYLYQMVQEVALYSLFSAAIVSLLAILCAGVIQLFVFKLKVYEDHRLKLTEDIINGFKQIKYLGWESFFENKVQNIRDKEFEQVKGMEYGDSFINFFRRITQSVLLFVTLQNIKNLGAINIFTSLVLFDKFVSPLNGLPWSIGTLLGSIFQLKRLNDYMNQIEIQEDNKIVDKKQIRESQIALKCKVNRAYWPYQSYYFSFKFLKRHFQVKEEDKPLAIQDIDFTVSKGSLVMFIGKVGSGKTAFFDLILNELLLDKKEEKSKDNKIWINGSVAYVCQNTWLLNESIRDNITFGKQFDQELYDKCLQISQLEKDVSQFPDQDEYMVGFNGGSLSGGQKQRLSLCRALYSDSDIYLLDDILSSVDENVAQNIFDKAILGYLIRERKKTVLISLNQYHYLQFAHEIIEIKQKTITNVTHNYSKNYSNKENPQIQSEVDQGQDVQDTPIAVQKEQENIQLLDSKNWKFYFKKMGFNVLLIFLISTLLHQGCQGIFEYWSHTFIQSLVDDKHKPLFLIGDFKQTLVIIFVALSILNIIRSFMYTYAELTSSKAIFKDLLKSTMFAKMKFLDTKKGIGFIVDRLFRDVEFLDCLPINYFFIVFFNAAQIIFILLSEFQLMAFSTIVLLYFIFSLRYFYFHLVVVISVYLFKKVIKLEEARVKEFKRNLKECINKPVNDRTTFIVETFKQALLVHLDSTLLIKILFIIQSGLKTIRSFEKQNFIKRNFLMIQKYKYAKILTVNQAEIIPFYLSKAIDYLGISIVCISAIYQIVTKDHSFNPANICMALAYSYRMMGSIQSSIRATQKIDRTEKVIQRVREFCEEKNEYDEMESSAENLANRQLAKNKDADNNLIEFENVFLSYLDNSQFALNNVSFKIQKGQKVAFCGRTGSGKTSIINCIARLYDTTSGNIILNNRNIKDYMIKDARKSFSIIPQHGFLFQGRLRDNIDPLNNYDDEQMKTFIKDQHLSIQRIEQSQEGKNYLDFQIEKSGKNLSNGEKQIVNFLQSIIQQKQIIILDEATSNMDPQTDTKIIDLLMNKLSKDKTLILISHRLENLKNFDVIYVMSNGNIIEAGTYNQLINNPNSHFASVLKSNYSIH